MSTNPMDSAEGREAFMYDLYPSYIATTAWGPLNEEAAEVERRLFAQSQGSLLTPVAAHALRKMIAERDLALFALRGIMRDLPVSRDWLDPTLEAAARAAVALTEGGAS